jgi:23S rRNA (uracil1939-C5)-methyltransferase
MKAGDRIDVEVYALNSEGRGVARAEGMTVFAEGALPGERALCIVSAVKRNYAEAALSRLLCPSAERALPLCPYFGVCGGCTLMHLKYSAQLEYKRRKVSDNLERIGKLKDVAVAQPIMGKHALRYRNKLSMPVRAVNGRIKTGFFLKNSHSLIVLTDCLLQPDNCAEVIGVFLNFADKHGISGFDPATGKGLVRHLVIRTYYKPPYERYIMLTVVVNGSNLPYSNELAHALRTAFGENFSLYMNLNPTPFDYPVTSGQYIHLAGMERLPLEYFGLNIELHPAAFFQVNDSVFIELFTRAAELLDEGKCDTVIDAYCGAGLLTALAARRAKRVIGIEISPEAVEDARGLCRRNGVTGAEFITADCSDALPRVLKNEAAHGGKTALILDPPRGGCAKRVIEAILHTPPQQILYISCDSATMARDIGLLKQEYTLLSVQPYDMFPYTEHIEVLAQLQRKQTSKSK